MVLEKSLGESARLARAALLFPPPSKPLALPKLAPSRNGAWARAGLGARAPAGMGSLNPAPHCWIAHGLAWPVAQVNREHHGPPPLDVGGPDR